MTWKESGPNHDLCVGSSHLRSMVDLNLGTRTRKTSRSQILDSKVKDSQTSELYT